MDTRIKVTFDGTSFQPAAPLPPGLKAGDAGEVVLANGKPQPTPDDGPKLGEPGSSLRVLAEANIDGPPDWATNLHKHPMHGPD